MKVPQLLLGLIVWLASLALAYYMGQSPSSEQSENQASQPASVLKTKEPINLESTVTESPADVAESLLMIAETDLDAALLEVAGLNEGETRALLVEAFALPANDFRRGRMIRELLEQFAQTQPEEALAMANEIGSLREAERARVGILEAWGRQNPQAALAWAARTLANEPHRTRRSQLVAIYRGFGASNPEAAFASALGLPAENRSEQRLQSDALEEIIETQIENGQLNTAKLQVENLPDGSIKSRLLREMVDEWASYDPEGAAAYVEAMGDAASASLKASLVGEWAENNPEAAAA